MVARYGNFVTYDPPLTPLTVLLWVLPVVAIGIGGWVIYARSRRRVRVVPDAFPEQSVPEGKRAGYIVYLPGIVVALIVAGVSYYQTGNYQQVKIWQQATAQAPALLDRALIRKADPLNEEEMSRLALGMRTQLQKNPGDIEAGLCWAALAWRWVTPVSPPMHTLLRIASIRRTAMLHWDTLKR